MKTMVVRSDSISDDLKAAFTIMEEASKDKSLQKIEWFSNLGLLLKVLEARTMDVEDGFKEHKRIFSTLQKDWIKAHARMFEYESSFKEMQESFKEFEKKIQPLLEDTKRRQEKKEEKKIRKIKARERE